MSTNNLDKNTKDRLDIFLKTNQPKAAAAPSNEFNRIMTSVKSSSHQNQRQTSLQYFLNRFRWQLKFLAPLTATAVILFIIIASPFKTDIAINDHETEYANDVYSYLYDDDNNYNSEIGDDWFALADAVAKN